MLIGQYVGSVPEMSPFHTSIAYLFFFLSILWLGEWPSRTSNADESRSMRIRGLGGALVASGLVGLVLGTCHLFEVTPVISWFEAFDWYRRSFGRALFSTLSFWPIATGLALLSGRSLEPRDFTRWGVGAGLGCLALLVAGVQYQDLDILVLSDTTGRVLVMGAAACLIASVLCLTSYTRLSLGLVLVAGLVVRAIGLDTWEPHPQTRDMLPLIQSAHDAFLAGEHPYRMHQMQKGSEVPLTYLPGLWLLYLLPRLLEADIRWMGLVADAVVVSSLWWLARTNDSDDEQRARAIALGIGAVWLFLPSLHWNGIYAEPHVWWGVLAFWLVSTLRRRWWLAALATGVAVSTRHFGIVVLPFVVIAMIRDVGWRATLPRLALSGGVASLLWLPFALPDPDAFWFGTYHWLREYGPAHQNWFSNMIGFSGLLYEADHGDWLLRFQAMAVLVTTVGYAIAASRSSARAPGRMFVASAGTAYIFFVMFNGIIWHSFYLGAFLFVAAALVETSRGTPVSHSSDTRLEPVLRYVGFALFILSSIAGGWLAYTLYDYRTETGLDDARDYLVRHLERGHHVLDRTRRHREFIDGAPIVAPSDVPADVELTHDLIGDDAHVLPDLPDNLWVVARTSWNQTYLRRLKRLGDVQSRAEFGNYVVLELVLPETTDRLSRHLETFNATYRTKGRELPKPFEQEPGGSNSVWKAPSLPGWVEIKSKRCEIGPVRETMMYLHPHRKSQLRLSWSSLRLGTSLLLYGGLENGAIRWNRGDVRIDVHLDGRHRETLVLHNRTGPWWTALDTRRWTGERHELELVVTTPDDRQRWTCLEGAVLGDGAIR